MKKTFLIKLAVLVVCVGLVVTLFSIIMTKRSVRVVFSEQAQIGVAGPIRLRFTQPMEKISVEDRIRFEPDVKVRFSWVENDLFIWPESSFRIDQYQLILEGGSADAKGRLIEDASVWSFSIRQPEFVYLYPASGPSDLWKSDTSGGSTTQLTRTDGGVFDYAVSKSGEIIAFSTANSLGGKDIWIMDRDGHKIEKLVNCGKDQCIEPAVSPDDTKIAYSKLVRGEATTGGGSKIWFVDLSTKKPNLLVDDPTINGAAAEWSPLGDRLAFLDEMNGLIRVFDIEKSEITNLLSSGQEAGAWSPDGRRMIIPLQYQVGVQAFSGLSLVDFEAEKIEPLFSQNPNSVDYFAPDYSPEGNQVIVGRREQLTNNGRSSIQLWLVDLATKKFEAITTDHNYSHGGFHWSPTGDQVVYQRFLLGSSKATPEIFIWDVDTGKSRLITENAAIPEWLP